jgi:hypothetical protein
MSIGPKLQALVDGDCIKENKANDLDSQQKDAIEALNMSQIYAIIEAREKVGPITTAEFI